MEPKIVGKISFGGQEIDVYTSLDEPLFRGTDIAKLVRYSEGNTWNMLAMCEDDEKLNLPLVVAGQKRTVTFVTETGLYNILSQSRTPAARLWRRVVHTQLIELRKSRGMDISDQFEEWDHRLDSIWYDEATGKIMQSVTVAGGDVEQVEYKGEA